MRALVGYSMFAVVLSATGCTPTPETALQRLVEARRLSADLLVQFTKAADAGNLAVMADTDEASRAFAHEAELAAQGVQTDLAALGPVLTSLGYSNESGLLQEFSTAVAEYRALDQTILGLAVENTNLKAQRLSFGAAHAAADEFAKEIEAVKPSAASDTWHAAALAATAVASVREIQALQAPHIAEAEDAEMSGLERRMDAAEAATRSALAMLGTLVQGQTRPHLTAAVSAFDRFMATNREVLRLSRRNSNVRSLALSLGQKRILTARCDEALRALRDGLEKRQVGGTR